MAAPVREQGMTPAHKNVDTAEAYPGWHQPAEWPGYQSLEPRPSFRPSIASSSPSLAWGPTPPAWLRTQFHTGAVLQHWYTCGSPCGVQTPLPLPEHPSSLNACPAPWLAAGMPVPQLGQKGMPAFPQRPPSLGPWGAGGVPGVASRRVPLMPAAAMGAGTLPHAGAFRGPPTPPDMLLSEMENAWGRDEGWLAVPDEGRVGEHDEGGMTQDRTEGDTPRGNECSRREPFTDPLLDLQVEEESRGPAASAGDACSKWAGPTRAEPLGTSSVPQRGQCDEVRARELSQGNSEPLAPQRKRRHSRKANSDSSLLGARGGGEGAALEGVYQGGSENERGRCGMTETEEKGEDAQLFALGSRLRVACKETKPPGKTASDVWDGHSHGPSPKKSRLHSPLGPIEPSTLVSEEHRQPRHPQKQQQQRPQQEPSTLVSEDHRQPPHLQQQKQHPRQQRQQLQQRQQRQQQQHKAGWGWDGEEEGWEDEDEDEDEGLGDEQQVAPSAPSSNELRNPLVPLPGGLTAQAAARRAVGAQKAHLDYVMGSYLAQACDRGQGRPLPCIFRPPGFKGLQ